MFKRKGQSTLEYALIIAVVVAGLVLMQHYVKRGFSGGLKQSADDMGEQFDPAVYTSTWKTTQKSKTQQDIVDRRTTTTFVDLGDDHAGYGQVSERGTEVDEQLESFATAEDVFK